MASRETNATNRITSALSARGCRLFKNVRGLFYTLDKQRKVAAGLSINGSSDVIGITPITITQDMIDQKIGVFTAIEVKKDAKEVAAWHKSKSERATRQRHFIKVMRENGGIAFCTHCPDDAATQIEKQIQALKTKQF